MAITIDLPESQMEDIRQLAERLGVRAEDLVCAVVADQLSKPKDDFEAAAERILEKNRELYQRLS